MKFGVKNYLIRKLINCWRICLLIASYLFPISIKKTKGDISPFLEVSLSNGRYMLDSYSVNYSYGGLNTIFIEIFKKIKIKDRSLDNILILGFGAGNIVSIIQEKLCIPCHITAIEKDKVVLDLAKKYFNISRFKNLKLINQDAFSYVLECNKTFDVIIVDVFIDNKVPHKFESKLFIKQLNQILSNEGILMHNKMVDSEDSQKEVQLYLKNFHELIGKYPKINIIPTSVKTNWIFSYEKCSSL